MSNLKIDDIEVGMHLQFIASSCGHFKNGERFKVVEVKHDNGGLIYFQRLSDDRIDYFCACYLFEFEIVSEADMRIGNKYLNKIAELKSKKQEYASKIAEIDECISVLEQANRICEVA